LSPVGSAVIKPFSAAGYAAPIYLMTAAESLFLQAEAVERGYLVGNARTLYESGIKESFKLLGLTAADAARYYSQTGVTNPAPANYYGIPTKAGTPNNGLLDLKIVDPNYATTPNKIEAIITQKWIANNGFNGYESWSEFRRTGYPSGNYTSLNSVRGAALVQGPQAVFPVRLPYPQSEQNNNPNTPKGTTLVGPRLFWDVD